MKQVDTRMILAKLFAKLRISLSSVDLALSGLRSE